MSQTPKFTLITIIAFGFYYILSNFYSQSLYGWFGGFISVKMISLLLTYLIAGIPLLIALFCLHKPHDIPNSLGVSKGLGKGFLVAFIFTLPMLIGFSIVYKFDANISLNGLFSSVIFAALFEELYFRGVLFGQVFRFTKIGFIPSILLGALLFASGHLWQSSDIAILSGIFMTTFMGAVWFAWVYIEWDNNLWVSIGLHLFMNLHWMLFGVADNALGGASANIFRTLTIAFTIIGTLLYKRRNGIKIAITRRNLWMKSDV